MLNPACATRTHRGTRAKRQGPPNATTSIWLAQSCATRCRRLTSSSRRRKFRRRCCPSGASATGDGLRPDPRARPCDRADRQRSIVAATGLGSKSSARRAALHVLSGRSRDDLVERAVSRRRTGFTSSEQRQRSRSSPRRIEPRRRAIASSVPASMGLVGRYVLAASGAIRGRTTKRSSVHSAHCRARSRPRPQLVITGEYALRRSTTPPPRGSAGRETPTSSSRASRPMTCSSLSPKARTSQSGIPRRGLRTPDRRGAGLPDARHLSDIAPFDELIEDRHRFDPTVEESMTAALVMAFHARSHRAAWRLRDTSSRGRRWRSGASRRSRISLADPPAGPRPVARLRRSRPRVADRHADAAGSERCRRLQLLARRGPLAHRKGRCRRLRRRHRGPSDHTLGRERPPRGGIRARRGSDGGLRPHRLHARQQPPPPRRAPAAAGTPGAVLAHDVRLSNLYRHLPATPRCLRAASRLRWPRCTRVRSHLVSARTARSPRPRSSGTGC